MKPPSPQKLTTRTSLRACALRVPRHIRNLAFPDIRGIRRCEVRGRGKRSAQHLSICTQNYPYRRPSVTPSEEVFSGVGRGTNGAFRGFGEPGSLGAVRRRPPMFRDAFIPEHWADIIFPECRGGRVRNRQARRPVYDLFFNRQHSLPVSMISQWRVSRSSKAAAIFASLDTVSHSPKGRFVVTATDMRSQAC